MERRIRRTKRGGILFLEGMKRSRWFRTLIYRYCVVAMISLIGIPAVFSLLFASTAEANDGSNEVYYKHYQVIRVSPGDTLWSIAEEYYMADVQTIRDYVDEVERINQRYDGAIYAGERILIPYYSTEFEE